MKRFLITFFAFLVSFVSLAQLNGYFNYGQDGHVYFYLTNNTRFNVPVSVFAHNARNNQSRSDRVTILAGNTFFFGLNYNWAWEQGETMTVTYSNGQSYTWACPESDMVHRNNSMYNNQRYYNNNINSNAKLSNIPPEGTTYHFGHSMGMYLVKVFQYNGNRKLSINYSIPAQTPVMGLFFVDNRGYITPDNNAGITNAGPYNNVQGLFQLNRSKIDFGPNMSYMTIDGKRVDKASDSERAQYYQYIEYVNRSRGQSISENRSSQGAEKKQKNPSLGSSGYSTCSKCGGRKYEVQDYKYAPSSTSGWNQPYHNNAGSSCYICGKATDHYHHPCSSCRGFGHN